MHDIARRAIQGTEPIAKLVEDFYGPGGPLVAAGWEVRPAQREMSLRFAAQIDGLSETPEPDMDEACDEEEDNQTPAEVYQGSVGLIEAPCGVGKGAAYLVPGFLAALRSEARYRGQVTVKHHPGKLMVSTANIALQAQLIRKDIPALGTMLGVAPRAVLMKSRQNYLCREKLAMEYQSLFAGQNPALTDVLNWSRQPGCDGDRESFPGDASEVWSRVSVGSDECGRQACAHYDESSGLPLCHWRAATKAWPHAHIIVGNHHWVALSSGIRVIAYAVDEAHELEAALRGIQGRTLTTATFVSAARRSAKVLNREPDVLERRLAEIGTYLLGLVERHLERHIDDVPTTDPRYRSPVPMESGWMPSDARRGAVEGFGVLRDLRDEVAHVALRFSDNEFRDGEIRTHARDKGERSKAARQAAMAANKLAELCRIYGAVAVSRPHPDWPSASSPWAIWAHREQDGRDVWRVVVELVPADVAPYFATLSKQYRTMVLASATLPDFTSMRLSLGLGTRWKGVEQPGWPVVFATDTGPYARAVVIRTNPEAEPDDGPEPEDFEVADLSDEPVSHRVVMSATPAPAPRYERRLPSPYALAEMGVLIVPDGPPPKDASWPGWAADRVVQAVEQSGGGALVLATSNAAMTRYTRALRDAGRWNVIRQGEQGRTRTIAAFKEDEDSVLVGTRSFFQGLDVQGRSCRLVVIDRIPFASPDDPLETAVGKLLVERAQDLDPNAQGATPWLLRSIPEASMVLVQGVGRLIRSQSDRGAVVLLDNRILYSGAGWKILLNSLPPFPLSRDVRDVGRVLAGDRPKATMYQAPRRERAELVC